jgi:WD40 repeat protein
VSGSWDKTIRLWDSATGEEKQRFDGHNDRVGAVALSLDSKTVASGSRDESIRLWDSASGEERKKLEGHNRGVTALTFSLDGKTVVLGSKEKTFRLWNSVTGEARETCQIPGVMSGIAHFNDASRSETDRRQLDLGTVPATHQATVFEPQSVLLLESSWIRYRGADFLWLPHEYRGVCHDGSGSSLVLGQASGTVSFLSFR